jgi:hypothetical protein
VEIDAVVAGAGAQLVREHAVRRLVDEQAREDLRGDPHGLRVHDDDLIGELVVGERRDGSHALVGRARAPDGDGVADLADGARDVGPPKRASIDRRLLRDEPLCLADAILRLGVVERGALVLRVRQRVQIGQLPLDLANVTLGGPIGERPPHPGPQPKPLDLARRRRGRARGRRVDGRRGREAPGHHRRQRDRRHGHDHRAQTPRGRTRA